MAQKNVTPFLVIYSVVILIVVKSSCSCSGSISTPDCDAYKSKSNQYAGCNCMDYLNDLFWDKKSKDWNGGYWNTANTVETSVNYINWLCGTTNITTQCNDILTRIESTADKYSSIPTNPKIWYDDLSWWSLAFMRMYQYTENNKYLSNSIIFADYVWNNAWDTKYCQGGLWWSYQKQYKNAIVNELGMTIYCKLYYITNNETYFDRCSMIYNWFIKTGMINKESLINDGLTINPNNHSDCYNNKENTWSYNQGVIFGGLKYLALIDNKNKQKYIDLAMNIFYAVNKTMTNDEGILHELVSASSVRSSNDAQQFKGIYIRYLSYLYQASFVINNQDIIQFVNKQFNGLTKYASDPKCIYVYDPVWDQSFSECDCIAQTSSLDVWNWALLQTKY